MTSNRRVGNFRAPARTREYTYYGNITIQAKNRGKSGSTSRVPDFAREGGMWRLAR
jgi:hypothetical protein